MHNINSKKQTKSDTKSPNLIITDRDLDIFRSLARYHLTGRMLFELSRIFTSPFTSVGNARTRLGQLHQMNFLQRDQRLLRGRSSNEFYYFLTRKSASLFEELRRLSHKNAIFRPISLINQAHSFLVSNIITDFRRGFNRHINIRFHEGVIWYLTVLMHYSYFADPEYSYFIRRR